MPEPARCRGIAAAAAAGVALFAGTDAAGYGPEGHLAAGRAAAPLLCEPAADAVAHLGGGSDLGELGLWADRIRSDPDYAAAGAWHYINVADDETLAAIDPGPEGDVLWAVDEFGRRLADTSLDDEARGVALKFLIHFIVDLHQPLHVGLAADRGGNTIALEFRGEATNLHRFWDSHVIEWTGESIDAYTDDLRRRAQAIGSGVDLDPLIWAGESLALRSRVYAFGQTGREPGRDYLEYSARLTRQRLTLATVRLAGTLNTIFCTDR